MKIIFFWPLSFEYQLDLFSPNVTDKQSLEEMKTCEACAGSLMKAHCILPRKADLCAFHY